MYGAALVAAAAAYYFQLLPGVGALLYDIGFLALALLVCSVASFALRGPRGLGPLFTMHRTRTGCSISLIPPHQVTNEGRCMGQ